MRISDWISDVCSSDLQPVGALLVVDPPGVNEERPRAPEPERGAIAGIARSGREDRAIDAQRQGVGIGDPAAGKRCLRLVAEHIDPVERAIGDRSEEHTSELQSLLRISYADFCLKKKKHK